MVQQPTPLLYSSTRASKLCRMSHSNHFSAITTRSEYDSHSSDPSVALCTMSEHNLDSANTQAGSAQMRESRRPFSPDAEAPPFSPISPSLRASDQCRVQDSVHEDGRRTTPVDAETAPIGRFDEILEMLNAASNQQPLAIDGGTERKQNTVGQSAPPRPHSPSQYEDVAQSQPAALSRNVTLSSLRTWLSLKQLVLNGIAVSDSYRDNNINPKLPSYSSSYLRLAIKYLCERKEGETDYRNLRNRTRNREPSKGPGAGAASKEMTEEEQWNIKNKHDNEMRAWKWIERSEEGLQAMLDAWVHLPSGREVGLVETVEKLMGEVVQIRNPVR